MSKTATARQLLIVALQDLLDAERAWTERGPALAGKSGDAVRHFLEEDMAGSAAQADRLRALLDGLGADHRGDANIWLRAVLDDATRDSTSIVAGPLRDTALIGAFRKGKQAERVSYETAIALAEALGRGDDALTLRTIRDEEASADAALAALLGPTVSAAAE